MPFEGKPQVSDVGDLGNLVVGVCRGERRRKGRGLPIVRHEHFLGLIDRSHSPAQAQAVEREERRWFNWGRGNTIQKKSAKRKAESPAVCTDGEDNHKILCVYSNFICVFS